MKLHLLKRAEELAGKTGHVLVATADKGGQPHLATAGKMTVLDSRRVGVSAWFCPGTVANVSRNRKAALVVWNAGSDEGLQLLGEVERIEELSLLDGYDPALEGKPQVPEVERQLIIRVDKVLRFSRAPHSDVEE
jgi:hypothetical protein